MEWAGIQHCLALLHVPGWSTTLTLPDWGRVAHSIDARRSLIPSELVDIRARVAGFFRLYSYPREEIDTPEGRT